LMATLGVGRFRSSDAPQVVGPFAQDPGTPPVTSPTVTLGSVDIPEGEPMVIHIDTDGVRITELPHDERPNALDESYTFLNRMEAIGE
jgi:hypothetical protein